MTYFREAFAKLIKRGSILVVVLIIGITASIAFTNIAKADTYTTRNSIPERHQDNITFLHGNEYEFVRVNNDTRKFQTLRFTYLYEDGTYTITNTLGKNIANFVILVSVVMLLVTGYNVLRLNEDFEIYKYQCYEARCRGRKNTSE